MLQNRVRSDWIAAFLARREKSVEEMSRRTVLQKWLDTPLDSVPCLDVFPLDMVEETVCLSWSCGYDDTRVYENQSLDVDTRHHDTIVDDIESNVSAEDAFLHQQQVAVVSHMHHRV